MLQLNSLSSLVKKRQRIGRGGCRGGTSTRGHKGQLARTGGGSEVKPFFEGGQMPLSRRLPQRGFSNNSFKTVYSLLSLSELDRHFNAGDVVNEQSLRQKGLLKGKDVLCKVLANGKISKALTVQVHGCTATARASIERAGGSVSLLKEMSGDSTAA